MSARPRTAARTARRLASTMAKALSLAASCRVLRPVSTISRLSRSLGAESSTDGFGCPGRRLAWHLTPDCQPQRAEQGKSSRLVAGKPSLPLLLVDPRYNFLGAPTDNVERWEDAVVSRCPDDSTVVSSHCVTRGAAAAGGGLAANGALEFALAEDRSAPRRQGRVAQLVRALVSHTRGPGFESLRDHS